LNTRGFIKKFLPIYLEAKNSLKKKKRKSANIISVVPIDKPSATIQYADFSVSENKELRNIIREILEDLLIEDDANEVEFLEESFGRYAQKKVPKDFDHLKWKLTVEQKHFLRDFIDYHPDSLRESDYQYAEKKTGIPTNSIKSIQNTYGNWNKKNLEPISLGRYELGNKDFITAKEYNIPQRYRNDVVNFKKVSKEYADAHRFPRKSLAQKKFESNLNSLAGGKFSKSNIVPEIDFRDWIMHYILGMLKPLDANMNDVERTVEIDFFDNENDLDVNKEQLRTNKKSKEWLEVEKLINEFNDVFYTFFIITDQQFLRNGEKNIIRLIITEIPVHDKMLWSFDEKRYFDWSEAPEHLRKEYLRNRAESRTKKINPINSKDLLDKYFNFDSDMFKI
jgi:hypothetical protein